MVALNKRRETKRRAGTDFSRGVAANTTIFAGSLVCLAATGFAVPGSVSTTLTADGVAGDTVDNSGGADGDVQVPVERDGAYHFGNSAAADEITAAEIGDNAYIVDDQTVAKTDGGATRSVAGKIEDVDAQGVWISFA
jgi:hypothetical protein